MIDQDATALAARPPRILVDESQSARVRIWRSGDADASEHSAELIDISRGGTKLRVSTSLRFEEAVRLRIQIPSIDLNCYVLASVRHIRPAGEGRWIVGCAVHPPLDEEAVARLATKASIDRRRWPRQPISLTVTVRRQLGSVDSEAVIVNFSRGGFCIRLREPCDAGERIRIAVPGGRASDTVEARTQWQIRIAGGHLTGCRFLRTEDYEVVSAAAGPREAADQAVASQASPGRLLWPAVAVLTCAASVMLFTGNGNPKTVPETLSPTSERPKHLGDAAPPMVDSEPTPADVARALAGSTEPSKSRDVSGAQETDRPATRSAGGPPLREWIDDTGQFQVTATLVASDEEHVTLLRADGREVRVPLARLSAADVEYVRHREDTEN